jgi:hypothetical protein
MRRWALLRVLSRACAAGALLALGGCVADGGYGGGYGYDYDYYDVGPDYGFYDGAVLGPAYYVGPGHFHGRYGPHGGPHPYRPAPGGHPPPSLPHGGGFRGGGFHGGAGGGRGGGGGHGGGGRGH